MLPTTAPLGSTQALDGVGEQAATIPAAMEPTNSKVTFPDFFVFMFVRAC